ncbi:hypothetical protein FNH22_25210 [Fulvivirga sp. M361]|uniref:hypothetical protein n=1 Tax=Fulvivirga sp. M361 TaxID=2594266 RepID=UPI00117AC9F2|nr:hypothetical protein [Fulvivirga sp. M361]TRX50954.1 hypothetical protein FNH22_25210 [Fulvivirga sp. M361]
MSSHHIVRDEQEPALLILDLMSGSENWFGELLEWAPTIMVASDQLEKVLSYGFKLDMVLCGEGEPEDLKQDLTHQAPLQFITATHNENRLSTALHYLVASGYNSVNIVSPFSSFRDTKLSDIENILTIVYYDGIYRWFRADGLFKKWVASGSEFVTSADIVCSANGNIKTCESDLGSSFQFKKEGWIEMSSSKPFWLGEKIIGP